MKIILSALIVAALSGCAVYPAGYYAEPAYVQPAYMWEPSVNLWFYHDGGNRHYMDRGWSPHGGRR